MRERVRLLNGIIAIESKPMAGTIIHARVSRAGVTLTVLAASAIRSPVTLRNLAGSGKSFTMKVETVSAASNDMYLPCQPITTPMVAEMLSWLGMQVLGEQEWEHGLYRVLQEMTEEGLLILWDRRLQIEIRDYDCRLVWAYTHQDSWIAKYIDLMPTTQVLLVISATKVERRPTALYEKLLRHQLGHVLRYLQQPKHPNQCYHATREWKKWSK